ncbi:recombinase family protein [Velocimicrobium porci]|uniref:Recombinase family protein n=1 Tax=Velocimicrobium porci TaxID=2606634 RepID=A0A6L5XX08_9FIRM|nr:recombinase family protein [Velocimicrobium porci]MSS63149.1 recombinase family protein [Velocimicrobium porci]
MSHIAIYTRKSVYSDKSDSVEAQYKLCVDYAKTHYEVESIVEYTDEGYTGANINRPAFTALLEDIKEQKIDVLICYKIDRISRDVKDFSNTFDFLQKHNVAFVSLKEQIDTSTPLGRAMMYISSVFAQMERETIAERVKDNMIELAKSGKWAGGNPPIGYKRKKILIDGKEHTTIEKDEETYPFYKMVCEVFLNNDISLSGMEAYFKRHNIKSYNGFFFSITQIYNILSNPHYVAADKETYKFFADKGCIMAVPIEKFDGTHGLIVYGRTKGGKKSPHKNNNPENWYVSVGLHEPLIDSKTWLEIQAKFTHNLAYKKRKHSPGLLTGIVRCSCGCMMSYKYKYDKDLQKEYKHYYCNKRIRQGKEYCQVGYVQTHLLDNIVLDTLKEISLDKNLIKKYIPQKEAPINARSKKNIEKDIFVTNQEIENLTNILVSNQDSTAAKYIVKKIEELDKQLASFNYELREVTASDRKQKQEELNIDLKYEVICNMVSKLEAMTDEEVNTMLKDIIKECVYDGENLKIVL